MKLVEEHRENFLTEDCLHLIQLKREQRFLALEMRQYMDLGSTDQSVLRELDRRKKLIEDKMNATKFKPSKLVLDFMNSIPEDHAGLLMEQIAVQIRLLSNAETRPLKVAINQILNGELKPEDYKMPDSLLIDKEVIVDESADEIAANIMQLINDP